VGTAGRKLLIKLPPGASAFMIFYMGIIDNKYSIREYLKGLLRLLVKHQTNPNSRALRLASSASASRFSDLQATPKFFQAVAYSFSISIAF
jgi:hypothetical protein